MAKNRPTTRPRKPTGADRPGIIRTLLSNQQQTRKAERDDLALRAVRASWKWMLHSPESRIPGVGIAALYPAGGVADLALGSGSIWQLAALSAPAAGAAWVSTWKAYGSKGYSGAVSAAAGAVPAWLATASVTGIFNWNTFLAFSAIGAGSWCSLRYSDVLTTRRGMREAQAEWDTLAAGIKALHGSRMVSRTDSPFGQVFSVDVRGTAAKTADAFPCKQVANEVAALFGLPEGRAVVGKNRKHAGLITVSVRISDPWKDAPVSPAMTGQDARRSVLDGPFVLGADPETGKPILLTVYDEDGGRHVMVVAGTGGGKTNLFSCVLEQATACDDVLTMAIDLGSGAIPGIWRDALDAYAGVDEIDKAIRILQWLDTIMKERTARSGGIEHVPTPTAPMILLVLDEMDAAIGFSGDRKVQQMQKLVNEIFRRGRKAGVVVMIAGQRGVSADTGSRTPHANSTKILLRVDSTSEIGHVIPDWQGAGVPDMSSYGQGAAGVVCVVNKDKTWQAGRSFHLDHKRRPVGVPQEIAHRRGAPTAALEPWIVERLDGYDQRRPAAVPAPIMTEAVPPTTQRGVELDQDAVDRQFADLVREAGPAPEPERERNVLELVIDHPEAVTTGAPEEFVELVMALLTQSKGEGVRLNEIVDAGQWGRTAVKAWLGQLREAGLIAHNGQATKAARWILPPE
jgi:hypothetical protein